MSLKDLAQQVRAEGRGKDTMLVHLTPNEVGGLQTLAKAAGGSLTINPKTGLPEASFLESLLPTILGFAANFIVPGSGMIVGGLTGAAQNKENPLLGAALGAMGGYGGGNIAGALQGAGAGAAQSAAMQGATAASQNIATGLPAFDPIAGQAVNAQMAGGVANAQSLAAIDATKQFMGQNMAQQAGQGIQALGTEAGRTTALQNLGGGMGALKSAGMAAAPGMLATPQAPQEEDAPELPRYDYTAGLTGDYYGMGDESTRERRYFTDPTFTRRAAAGGIMSLAEGGETAPKDPAQGMTGASADAMRYLMGQTNASPATVARQQAIEGMKSAPAQSKTPARESQLSRLFGGLGGATVSRDGALFQKVEDGYTFDPQSQTYTQRYTYKPYTPPPPVSEGNPWGAAKGGLASLAQGGFVVPADVVSMAGEGNTDAGYERLQRMLPGASPIKGSDGGQADTVKTSIEGKQPARVAHGEMYVPPATVKRAGGAKKLYAMMDNVRKQAKGDAKQIKPVNLRKAMA
jgi:hypothetical protein